MMAQSAEVMKYENEDVDLAMLFFTHKQDDRETNSNVKKHGNLKYNPGIWAFSVVFRSYRSLVFLLNLTFNSIQSLHPPAPAVQPSSPASV